MLTSSEEICNFVNKRIWIVTLLNGGTFNSTIGILLGSNVLTVTFENTEFRSQSFASSESTYGWNKFQFESEYF